MRSRHCFISAVMLRTQESQMPSEALTKLSNYGQIHLVTLPVSEEWLRLSHFGFTPQAAIHAQKRTKAHNHAQSPDPPRGEHNPTPGAQRASAVCQNKKVHADKFRIGQIGRASCR